MDHSHLVEKVLHEIANARMGIAANYARLWRVAAPIDPPADRRQHDQAAREPPDQPDRPPQEG